MSAITPSLPAVVLGIDTPIGLTIVRDLGRAGVAVTGIGRTPTALGLSSHYLARGLVRAKGEAALIAQLVELAVELGPCVLFAVSEGDIALLNRHRPALSGYKLLFADEARMNRVLNKDRTYEAAARVGVRVPRTEQVNSLEQARALCAELRFPVVLKWANPVEVGSTLSAAGIHLDKLHYCYTAEALLRYLAPFEQVALYPLIQEYCAGYGLGQFVLMKDGQAHYTFQHRRVHEWPPEGGFSSLCESVGLDQHRALMEQSVALLRELEWEGTAMVEYRFDPATGEAALMEINGRFWGSLPLAYHAGARFPWLTYVLLGLGQPLPAQAQAQAYRSGVRCRFMLPETKRLLRVLFAQRHIADKSLSFPRLPALLGYLFDFVRPRSTYYVFEWRDPRPFFSDMGQMLGKSVQALTRRLR